MISSAIELECPSCNSDDPGDFRDGCEDPWHVEAGDESTRDLADAVTDLGRLAMQFSLIDRTACYHPDQQTRESDSDHTVMLAWVAPALAHRLYPARLNPLLVAAFAVVHDAPEVYAGDTPTLRIDAGGHRAKAAREAAAVCRLRGEFGPRLPWFTAVLGLYEEQELIEARFVRAVDKILPKIVHQIDRCHGLIEEGITPPELAAILAAQEADMASYAGEFTALMDLYQEMGSRAVALLEEVTNG